MSILSILPEFAYVTLSYIAMVGDMRHKTHINWAHLLLIHVSFPERHSHFSLPSSIPEAKGTRLF
jgi:hypothetical protein